MIMYDSRSIRRAEDNRACYASALARYAKERRAELGLTVEQAAELAGMNLCEWAAMEDGWVPRELPVIRAIAGTLQVRWTDLNLLALFARVNQRVA